MLKRFGREEIFLSNDSRKMAFRVSVGQTVVYFAKNSGEKEFKIRSDDESLREAIEKQEELTREEYGAY